LNAKAAATRDTHKAEVPAFGWWFVSEKFENDWAITQLKEALMLVGVVDPGHWVMERLTALAPAMPLQAMSALDLMPPLFVLLSQDEKQRSRAFQRETRGGVARANCQRWA
jgi:hypothetical protein